MKALQPFLHRCGVCGADNAPFGYYVNMRKGKRGYWRCFEHRMEAPGSTIIGDSDSQEILKSSSPRPARPLDLFGQPIR